MAISSTQFMLICMVGILILAKPAHAFGAGNIASMSKIEGQNWRHGDLEDTFLTLIASRAMGGKKFSKLDVKRIYLGNWMRDYSQAIDVGTVKHVSAKAITILLWVLGFMTFGYGTNEFEVTMERLGCYRPEEHIDNPKDYADNEDARQYDPRLRGPINERRELAVDEETGMKNYIASENLGITTSAGLIRKLFGESIELGRRYARNSNKADLHEALRLLGTGCHCLEDFSAHSNYTELALIELGERDIFPHVGRRTQIQLRGARRPVYPLITGTFGGVDFLHSVTGEFDDKVTQSEIQELENTMNQAQQNQGATSMLQDLLNKLPSGIFGGKDEAGKADELKQNALAHQMQNSQVSPRQPEEWTQYLDDVRTQIFPIIQFHDEIMQSISVFVEKIPILPELLEGVQEQLNVFVFSLIAPFVLPIINQVKSELTTGSSTIIESSAAAQHIVFNDDHSSDPTHSMLSKDHFSNVLNEPAGKVAGQVLKWVVPQLIAAWDDERVNVNQTLNRIIQGVLHHPALRDQGQDGAREGRQAMFNVVQQWWSEKSESEKDGLRDQISRSGVEEGRNHKPGVVDHGHGSCKPLGMSSMGGGMFPSSTNTSGGRPSGNNQIGNQAANIAASAVGGGALGGLVGGLVSNIGSGILGGDEGQQTFNSTSYGDNGRTQTVTQIGSSGGRYEQAQYKRTDNEFGRTEEYNRYEQSSSGGRYTSEVHHEERTSHGGFQQETRRYDEGEGFSGRDSGRHQGSRRSNEFNRQEEDMPGGFGSRREEESSYGGGLEQNQYGSGRANRRHEDSDDYGRQQQAPHESNRFGRTNDGDEYGANRRFGQARNDSESEGYGARHNEPERRFESERPRYGAQNEDSDDSRPQRRFEPESRFGQDESYGRGRNDQDEDRNQEFGGRENNYERRRDEDESEEPSYGRRQQQYGQQEESEYGY